MDQDRNTKAKAATSKAFPAPLLNWKSSQKNQREIYYTLLPLCASFLQTAQSQEGQPFLIPEGRR